MDAYADTNLLKEYYLPLARSTEADRLIASATEQHLLPFPVTRLLYAELTNAFHFSVFCSRTGNGPRATPEMATFAEGLLADDVRDGVFLIGCEPAAQDTRRHFEQLVHRHTAR